MKGPPRRTNWPVSAAHVGHGAVGPSPFFTHFIFTSEGLLTDERQTPKWSSPREAHQILVGVLVLVKWLMISIRRWMKLTQEIWLNVNPHLLHKTFFLFFFFFFFFKSWMSLGSITLRVQFEDWKLKNSRQLSSLNKANMWIDHNYVYFYIQGLKSSKTLWWWLRVYLQKAATKSS